MNGTARMISARCSFTLKEGAWRTLQDRQIRQTQITPDDESLESVFAYLVNR